jgi:hypothetical protein
MGATDWGGQFKSNLSGQPASRPGWTETAWGPLIGQAVQSNLCSQPASRLEGWTETEWGPRIGAGSSVKSIQPACK